MEKSSELDYVNKTSHANRRILNVEAALFVTMATINGLRALDGSTYYIVNRLMDT
jgi:hypothetical protein